LPDRALAATFNRSVSARLAGVALGESPGGRLRGCRQVGRWRVALTAGGWLCQKVDSQSWLRGGCVLAARWRAGMCEGRRVQVSGGNRCRLGGAEKLGEAT
tara:strand:+ start:6627 stop:6929 length:303 start_codon:yes stop_codon:yes gene_type:complete